MDYGIRSIGSLVGATGAREGRVMTEADKGWVREIIAWAVFDIVYAITENVDVARTAKLSFFWKATFGEKLPEEVEE